MSSWTEYRKKYYYVGRHLFGVEVCYTCKTSCRQVYGWNQFTSWAIDLWKSKALQITILTYYHDTGEPCFTQCFCYLFFFSLSFQLQLLIRVSLPTQKLNPTQATPNSNISSFPLSLFSVLTPFYLQLFQPLKSKMILINLCCILCFI